MGERQVDDGSSGKRDGTQDADSGDRRGPGRSPWVRRAPTPTTARRRTRSPTASDRRRRRRRPRAKTKPPRAVRRRLLAPLRHSLRVSFDGESWELPGAAQGPRRPRRARSKKPWPPARTAASPAAWSATSPAAEVEREHPGRGHLFQAAPSTASSATSPRKSTANRQTPTSRRAATRSKSSPARYGRKLRDNQLTGDLNAAVLNANAPPQRSSPRSTPTKPEVTKRGSRRRVPVLPDPRPRSFTLRLWEHLKLAKTYTVAVGRKAWKPRKACTKSRKRKKTRPGTCRTPPGPGRLAGTR